MISVTGEATIFEGPASSARVGGTSVGGPSLQPFPTKKLPKAFLLGSRLW